MFGLIDTQHGQIAKAFRDQWDCEDVQSDQKKLFRERLRLAKDGNTPIVLENCTFEDSASVHERFFLDCNDEIRIVARGLRREIFSNTSLVYAAVEFVKKKNAKLILDMPSSNRNEVLGTAFYNAVIHYASSVDNIITRFYHVENRNEFIPDEPSVTFGDNLMLRKKKYQPDGNYSRGEAEVYFNAPEEVAELSAKVDSALEKFEIVK